MKKIWIAFCMSILFICTTTFETKAETRFSDLPAQSNELTRAVHQLHDQQIIFGFSDGTFRPNDLITREQFAVILARALALDTSSAKATFKDVSKTSVYYSSIAKLSEMGIINGFPDGLFHPQENVTRLQAATMLNRAFKINFTEDNYFFTDVEANNQHVKALYFNGITNGMSDTEFGPAYPITRGQASIFIYRIQQMKVRGNVVYYTSSFLPISTIRVVDQSDDAVRLVPSANGLRIIPLRTGEGHFIVKGILNESTIPIEQHIAYAYAVELRDNKYYVTVQQVELSEVIEHKAHYYTYETLQLPFIPTYVTVHNAFDLIVSEEQYYIGSNAEGIEIALFEPGYYSITFSNGQQSTHFKAITELRDFTTVTNLIKP